MSLSTSLFKNGVEFSKAKQTFLEVGCVGCHYLNGYNDVKPIGPHLNNLPAKVSADWAFRWIKNPRDYNTQTRMPNFKFNNDQSEAITAYLFKIGKESEFKSNFANGTYKGGNATEGMKILKLSAVNLVMLLEKIQKLEKHAERVTTLLLS